LQAAKKVELDITYHAFLHVRLCELAAATTAARATVPLPLDSITTHSLVPVVGGRYVMFKKRLTAILETT
jgi:hypothetical protein